MKRFPHLTRNEQRALTDLLAHLRGNSQIGVEQIILFGSGARGNRSQDSDVDLLIVMRSADWREYDLVRKLAAHFSNEYDVFISPHIMASEQYQQLSRLRPLFYRDFQNDRIELFSSTNLPFAS